MRRPPWHPRHPLAIFVQFAQARFQAQLAKPLGLLADGVGVIFNHFEGDRQTASSVDFNKLHRAWCPECDPSREHSAMTVHTSGQKLFFPSFRAAIDWLMDRRPGNYSKCTRCNPA